jgi:hypothetical protein
MRGMRQMKQTNVLTTLTRNEVLASTLETQSLRFAQQIARQVQQFNEYVITENCVFARTYDNDNKQIAGFALGYSVVDQQAEMSYESKVSGHRYAQFIDTTLLSIEDALDAFLIRYHNLLSVHS